MTDDASRLARAEERIDALDRLLEAKFVRIEAMIGYEADKVSLALAASDKAIQKAEAANEKRLEAMNEFRAQLLDQTKTFLTRDTFDIAIATAQTDRELMRQQVSNLQLANAGLMTREQVGDAIRLPEAAIERNREDLAALKVLSARMAGIAIGVSTAISLLAVVIAIVLQFASGK